MDELTLPDSPMQLAERLSSLAATRQKRHAETRQKKIRRKSLTSTERSAVKSKTDGLCHICGGEVGEKWQADHVLCHSNSGQPSVENLLASHALCNNYRWDYSPEEFQWILKIGVWARTQMAKKKSRSGSELIQRFFRYEIKRQNRKTLKRTE